jgi:PBP1b-binding outer membrane lipoprotein LpoB
VGRLITILTAIVLVAGCKTAATPVATPQPSPTPHTAVTAAVLQPGEVQTNLNPCPGSGPIATYLTSLAAADPALASRMTSQWQQLRAAGALDGAISLFAADPTACTAQLAATSKIQAATSFVAVFADEGQADRAWETGVFGFVPPPPGQASFAAPPPDSASAPGHTTTPECTSRAGTTRSS